MDVRWITPSGIERCQSSDVPSLLERDVLTIMAVVVGGMLVWSKRMRWW